MASLPVSGVLRASGQQNSRPPTLKARAADVLVLGDGAMARSIAFAAARRGKKVIHLSNMGLQTTPPSIEKLRPLFLTDSSMPLASLAEEAAAYWTGLQMQAGSQLVWQSPTVDLAPRWANASKASGNQAQRWLSHMEEMSNAAGVPLRSMSGSALITAFPMLRLPNGSTSILQAGGLVIDSAAVNAALSSLEVRSSVHVVEAGIQLTGFKDLGSAFRVRASSPDFPDLVYIYEAEQLVIAPGVWAHDSFQLFGLNLDLQLVQRSSVQVAAGDSASQLPLLRVWTPPPAEASEPSASPPRSPSTQQQRRPDTPPQSSKSSQSSTSSQSAGRDEEATPLPPHHWLLYPRAAEATGCKLTARHTPLTSLPVRSCWQVDAARATAAAGKQTASQAQRDQSGRKGEPEQGEEWQVRSRQPLPVERQQAAGLVKELGGAEDRQHGGALDPPVPARPLTWDVVSPDGLPVLGWHPGYESGRVLVACTAGPPAQWELPPTSPQPQEASTSSSTSAAQGTLPLSPQNTLHGNGGRERPSMPNPPTPAPTPAPEPLSITVNDSWQLTPLLAKTAADMLQGSSLGWGHPLSLVSLASTRPMLGEKAGRASALLASHLDPWEELSGLQSGSLYRADMHAVADEEAQQAAEEAAVLSRPRLSRIPDSMRAALDRGRLG